MNEKPSFLTPPPPIPDDQIKETVTTDIVVVGAGFAGCSAAVHAGQLGAKVVLLEKTGTPQFRGANLACYGSKYQLGKPDRMEIQKQFMRYAGYRNDQRIVRLWTDYSGETLDWILEMALDLGLEYQPLAEEDQLVPGSDPPYLPTYAFNLIPNEEVLANSPPITNEFTPRMAALCYVLKTKAEKAGVDIRYNTPAVQLIREGEGRVTGVIAKKADGSYLKINAQKGVILCAGDYGHNEEMIDYYIGPWVKDIINANYYPVDANTGDGQQMGMWVGAEIDKAPHCPMIFDNACNEPFPARYAPRLARQPWLAVNKRGERFCDEDQPIAFLLNGVLQQPDYVKWIIWDDKFEEDVELMNQQACKSYREKTKISTLPNDWQEQLEAGELWKADTLEDLAKQIDVPFATLKATIDRYNELARKGYDEDFGKRAQSLTTVEKAPFYAYKLGWALLVTLGGLKVNDKLQVLDAKKEVIPGLYAAGNCSGGFYFNDYPIGMAGNSHGRALTFGYVASQRACELE